jgi:ectoine hydroxylase-related dioxygenase (phytanoyl-CoA dioxygenase family)
MDSRKLLENYHKNGYLLFKNIFDRDEIIDFKNRIATLTQAPDWQESSDVLSLPSLRSILLDNRVLDSVKILLGSKIVYFGDSSVRYDKNDGSRGFHKDSLDDFEDPSSTDYPIIRLGIYMQDHVNHSGGLKVRRGSHKHVFLGRSSFKRLFSSGRHGYLKLASFGLGRATNLDIEPGDLVIWNLRVLHSGHALRLKMFPKICINPRFEKYIPRNWSLANDGPRAVIFASFGAPSTSLESYIKERVENPSNKKHWKSCHYDDPEVIELCKKKGVQLRFDGIKFYQNTR